jgi:pyruvate,orthophosphate dikinase
MKCNVKAIFKALIELKKSKIKSAFVEIMIPLVSTDTELKILRELVNRTAKKIETENKIKVRLYGWNYD